MLKILYAHIWAYAKKYIIAIFKQLTSFKIIEFNRVSIIFHVIFRINVELNFDLKFSSGILSEAFKKIGGKILKFTGNFSEFCSQIFKRPNSKFHSKT